MPSIGPDGRPLKAAPDKRFRDDLGDRFQIPRPQDPDKKRKREKEK
jgi:hypothetical protein